MSRNLSLGIAVMAIVGAVIFSSCKKDGVVNEKTEMKSETLSDEMQKSSGHFTIVDIYKGQHGIGSGKEKYCGAGGSGCWLWFRNEKNHLIPTDMFTAVSAIVTSGNDGFGDDDDRGNSNNNRAIILNFLYQYNTAENLSDFFNLEDNLFVLEEEVEEEGDSCLSGLLNVDIRCIIPAGSYPISVNEAGIRVELPVIIIE